MRSLFFIPAAALKRRMEVLVPVGGTPLLLKKDEKLGHEIKASAYEDVSLRSLSIVPQFEDSEVQHMGIGKLLFLQVSQTTLSSPVSSTAPGWWHDLALRLRQFH